MNAQGCILLENTAVTGDGFRYLRLYKFQNFADVDIIRDTLDVVREDDIFGLAARTAVIFVKITSINAVGQKVKEFAASTQSPAWTADYFRCHNHAKLVIPLSSN
jgi:hypothetical protein